mmetsp:Transcript_4432/g.8069  ORF Transcript_4432/g.8069 Transcript_4432/m.8069 type:complete len:297 (+) Transcript_4432:104-994(+)
MTSIGGDEKKGEGEEDFASQRQQSDIFGSSIEWGEVVKFRARQREVCSRLRKEGFVILRLSEQSGQLFRRLRDLSLQFFDLEEHEKFQAAGSLRNEGGRLTGYIRNSPAAAAATAAAPPRPPPLTCTSRDSDALGAAAAASATKGHSRGEAKARASSCSSRQVGSNSPPPAPLVVAEFLECRLMGPERLLLPSGVEDLVPGLEEVVRRVTALLTLVGRTVLCSMADELSVEDDAFLHMLDPLRLAKGQASSSSLRICCYKGMAGPGAGMRTRGDFASGGASHRTKAKLWPECGEFA